MNVGFHGRVLHHFFRYDNGFHFMCFRTHCL
jgi:hypothetical protein